MMLFMQIISAQGEQLPLLFSVVLLLVWYISVRRYKLAGLFLTANLLTIGIVQILKKIVAEPRPLGALEMGFGFPSQHTASYVVFWGILMITTNSKLLKLLGLLMILMVGISRVYLGEHTVIDVIGGYVIGFMVLVLSWWWISRSGL